MASKTINDDQNYFSFTKVIIYREKNTWCVLQYEKYLEVPENFG